MAKVKKGKQWIVSFDLFSTGVFASYVELKGDKLADINFAFMEMDEGIRYGRVNNGRALTEAIGAIITELVPEEEETIPCVYILQPPSALSSCIFFGFNEAFVMEFADYAVERIVPDGSGFFNIDVASYGSSLIVAFARRDVIEEFSPVFEALGLEPKGVCSRAVSVAASGAYLMDQGIIKDQKFAIVDANADCVSFCLFDRADMLGCLDVPRNLGVDRFRALVEAFLNESEFGAFNLYVTKSVFDYAGNIISDLEGSVSSFNKLDLFEIVDEFSDDSISSIAPLGAALQVL